MTFQIGQSGNPGGRPSQDGAIKALARKHTKAAIATLAHLMKTSDQPPVRVSCAVALLDRGWGRPAQALTNEDGSPLQIQTIVFAALREAAELPAPYVDADPVRIETKPTEADE